MRELVGPAAGGRSPPRENGSGLTPLARGLAARLRDASEAADRLAAFAFDAGGGDDHVQLVLGDDDEPGVAHDFVLRALGAAGDALNFRILEAAGATASGVVIDDLAREVGLRRLALIERVHGLIGLGLLARDLQSGSVRATAAGLALLELVIELESEVAQWLGKRRRR